MTDRPIPFSPAMIEALLAGTKTQTRRVVKPQPEMSWPFPHSVLVDKTRITDNAPVAMFRWQSGCRQDIKLPHAIDDHLWVREAWGCHWATDDQKPSDIDPELWSVLYRADSHVRPAPRDGSKCPVDLIGRYRPPMFMPRWASRLTLTVTDVRVQRVQDISEDDAKAEGILFIGEDGWSALMGDGARFYCAKDAFHHLWNSLNEARGYGWDANPWVSATTFTIERRNIDQKGSEN